MSGGGGRGGRFYWVKNEEVTAGKVKGIVILFAWVSIQENNLKDYTDLYLSFGWNSLVCLADFLNPIIPDRASSLAFSILAELVPDLRLKPCPVVLVSLSGGSQACMYKVFQIIDGESEVQFNLEENELVRNCICGQIYDSGPVDFTSDLGARFALNQTILRMPGSAKLASLVAKGITSSLDTLFLTRFGSQSTDYWQTLHSSASLGAPFLILCSESDEFAPYTSICNFSQRLLEVGANVKVVKWKNSPHAGHYKVYPIQYRAAVLDLLERSLSTFIHKIQRLRERIGMEGMPDEISDIICDLQNAAVNSNQSLRRVAVAPSDHFFLPSSKEYQSGGDSRQEERSEKLPSCSNPKISAHSVLGQILFDACVPKNIEEGWDIKFSGSLNGQPYGSACRRSPLNAIKLIRRSRL